MQADMIQKAGEVIQKQTARGAAEGAEPYCVLALMDGDGYPTASTITAAAADGIREIAFCTGLSGHKPERIGANNRASVCFNSMGYNITLVGTIAIVTDPAVKTEMWYEGLRHHFTGPDDPNYCVLRFTTRRYNVFVDWQEAEGLL